MNFRRIDKNTVQCRMSEEEMEEYGFKIEDFFTDQDKAREFLEQLVERAEEEVGYEVEGGVVSMQLMRMPDNSLIITFSDQSPEGMNNMLNQIRHLAGSIDDETAEAIVEGLKNGEIPDVDDQAAIHTSENMDLFQKKNTVDADKENYQKYMKDLAKIRRDKEKSLISSAKVYSFDNLDGLEQFAADFYTKKNINSKLFRDQNSGTYYLLIKKGKLKMDEYQYLCRRLSDYGTICSPRPYMEQYCKEHYKCLISKHAIRALQAYCL